MTYGLRNSSHQIWTTITTTKMTPMSLTIGKV